MRFSLRELLIFTTLLCGILGVGRLPIQSGILFTVLTFPFIPHLPKHTQYSVVYCGLAGITIAAFLTWVFIKQHNLVTHLGYHRDHFNDLLKQHTVPVGGFLGGTIGYLFTRSDRNEKK